MKLGLICIFLLLGTLFVSAEISVSCSQDSDCSLALADDSYFCEESLCQKEGSEEAVLRIEPRTDAVDWDLIVVEEKKEFCPENTCLSFAPKNEIDTWFSRFIDFLLYL